MDTDRKQSLRQIGARLIEDLEAYLKRLADLIEDEDEDESQLPGLQLQKGTFVHHFNQGQAPIQVTYKPGVVTGSDGKPLPTQPAVTTVFTSSDPSIVAVSVADPASPDVLTLTFGTAQANPDGTAKTASLTATTTDAADNLTGTDTEDIQLADPPSGITHGGFIFPGDTPAPV